MKTRTITTAESGSDNPEPQDVAIAIPGEYPDGHQESSPGWKAAWDHAAKHKNTPKACMLYADAHSQDHDAGGIEEDSEEVLKARIAELEALVDKQRDEMVKEENEKTKTPRKRGKSS